MCELHTCLRALLAISKDPQINLRYLVPASQETSKRAMDEVVAAPRYGEACRVHVVTALLG